MMPLSIAEPGEELIIKKIGGSPDVKKHLEDLGFTVGSEIMLINKLGENVIVKVKDSRIAINDKMAAKIMI